MRSDKLRSGWYKNRIENREMILFRVLNKNSLATFKDPFIVYWCRARPLPSPRTRGRFLRNI